MSRNELSQRQRTQQNPLNLGTFNQTSIRYLTGRLGPQSKVVGYRDTNQLSNGGFGGGAYNHWFQINLSTPAWIITAKGDPRPQYIQVSAYELDKTPIQGRGIFDADSVSLHTNEGTYYPYIGHVMAAGSNLYNNFNPNRLDLGNELYFPLNEGSYLICISTTRNEPLDYGVAIVVEVAESELELALETGTGNLLLFEDNTDIILDTTESYSQQDTHEHSLSEWTVAWDREHQQDERFPAVLVPLTTLA